MQVGLGALAELIDQVAGREPVEPQRGVQLMRLVVGDCMGEAETGCRRWP